MWKSDFTKPNNWLDHQTAVPFIITHFLGREVAKHITLPPPYFTVGMMFLYCRSIISTPDVSKHTLSKEFSFVSPQNVFLKVLKRSLVEKLRQTLVFLLLSSLFCVLKLIQAILPSLFLLWHQCPLCKGRVYPQLECQVGNWWK